MKGLVSPSLGNAQGTFGRVCAAEKDQSLEIIHLSFISPTKKSAFVRERDHIIAEETFAGYLIVYIGNQGAA